MKASRLALPLPFIVGRVSMRTVYCLTPHAAWHVRLSDDNTERVHG